MNAEVLVGRKPTTEQINASMGPRLDERGSVFVFRGGNVKREELQWGRVWMNAEVSEKRGIETRERWLQWGRVWMNAEVAFIGYS